MRNESMHPDDGNRESDSWLEAALIRVVNHHRHDWMNDLQVLLGYIQLNKPDRLRAYIDELQDKLYRESLVAKLGDQTLIAFLFTFRADDHPLTLTVRPVRDINLLLCKEGGADASAAMIAAILAYCASARLGAAGGNELAVSLDLIMNQAGWYDLVMAFEYTGDYDPTVLKDKLQDVIKRYQEHPHRNAECEFQDSAVDLELRQRWTGMDEVMDNVLR